MADYKELLRRAISALPENNGAARRAVYEKARSALVGQLRAIQPPLPARDITQHRLQLEDCIRQVEQEASEAIISLSRDGAAAMSRHQPTPPPAAARTPIEKPTPTPIPRAPEPLRAEPKPVPAKPVAAEPAPVPEAPAPLAPPPASASVMSIEDIISQASEATGAGVEIEDKTAAAPQSEPVPPPAPTKFPLFSSRRDAPTPPPAIAKPFIATPRVEPSLGNTALALQVEPEPNVEPAAANVDLALSSEREVEVEHSEAREAEGVIERAIETLDREARGEKTEPLPESPTSDTATGQDQVDDAGFAIPGTEPRAGTGMTIFLIVFVLLLAGVGGGGFWAWREGYVDLDQMFGRAQPSVTETATVVDQPSLPTMDAETGTGENAAGPGNTATTTSTEPTTALEGLEPEERLEPTPEPVQPTGTETVLPSISNGENKTEERLSGQDTTIAATDPAASVDPAVLAGSQSLLLEASSDGRSPVVPFSGTVDWSEGVDEIGMPTLIAEASIPARNLDVSITIRKNADPALPASHLMEISFDVPDTFIGGSIGSLAGVLLKNEELVPGTELTGASARVVGNSFLFALSASPADLANNMDLLGNRRWIDLAIIYGTGRNAILTLEKDTEAQALFTQVFAAWGQ